MSKSKKDVVLVKQGQDADPIDSLPYDSLNRHEQAIVSTLNGEGSGLRTVLSIVDIMYANNWQCLGKAKGNSRVRNSLRRLVRASWVEHPEDIGDGRYRITGAGRKRLRRFEAKKTTEGKKATQVEAPAEEKTEAA